MVSEADLHAFHLSRIAPPPPPSAKLQISAVPPPNEPVPTITEPLLPSKPYNTNLAPIPSRKRNAKHKPITEADMHAFHISRICGTYPKSQPKPQSTKLPKQPHPSRRKRTRASLPALPRTGPSNPRLSLSTYLPLDHSFTSNDFSQRQIHGSGDLPPLTPSPPATPSTRHLELEDEHGYENGDKDEDDEYDQLQSSSVVNSQRSDRTIRPIKLGRGNGVGEVIEEEGGDGRGPPSSPLAEKGGGLSNGNSRESGMTGKAPRKSKVGGRAGELRGSGEDPQRRTGPIWATRTPVGA